MLNLFSNEDQSPEHSHNGNRASRLVEGSFFARAGCLDKHLSWYFPPRLVARDFLQIYGIRGRWFHNHSSWQRFKHGVHPPHWYKVLQCVLKERTWSNMSSVIYLWEDVRQHVHPPASSEFYVIHIWIFLAATFKSLTFLDNCYPHQDAKQKPL